MSQTDRRRSRRLEMKLPIVVRQRDGDGDEAEPERELAVVHAYTSNISTDGLYFELGDVNLRTGDEIELELTIPPAAGVSAFEGRVVAQAAIVRIDALAN